LTEYHFISSQFFFLQDIPIVLVVQVGLVRVV